MTQCFGPPLAGRLVSRHPELVSGSIALKVQVEKWIPDQVRNDETGVLLVIR